MAVNVHDSPDQTLGKAIPYGIYDIGADNGFVNVGITKETAAFAVASIRSWWQQLGSVRPRDLGLPLPARHQQVEQNRAPPLELHRQGLAWPAAGQPRSHRQLDRRDDHQPGLKVYAQLDQRDYPQGIEVTDAQLAAVNLHRDGFHGDWNYTIKPSTQ